MLSLNGKRFILRWNCLSEWMINIFSEQFRDLSIELEKMIFYAA